MIELLLATLIQVHEGAFPDEQRTCMSIAVQAVPLGEQIDAIYELKVQKRSLEDEAENLQRIIDVKEQLLQESMEEQGTVKATGRRASASVGETIVPQVEDWDAFYSFIRKNNAFELLQRRPAVEAWRERALSRRDKTVPGTVPFTKRKVSIRVS